MALVTRANSNFMLPTIKIPTLIIVGEDDIVTPLSESVSLYEKINKSVYKVIKKSGHITNLEKTEEFNVELSNFINNKENNQINQLGR